MFNENGMLNTEKRTSRYLSSDTDDTESYVLDENNRENVLINDKHDTFTKFGTYSMKREFDFNIGVSDNIGNKKYHENINEGDEINKNQYGQILFTFASGKKVPTPSKESIDIVKSKFGFNVDTGNKGNDGHNKNINEVDKLNKNQSGQILFTFASGRKAPTPSEECIDRMKRKFGFEIEVSDNKNDENHEDVAEEKKTNKNQSGQILFTFASGRKAPTPSEESINRLKHKFGFDFNVGNDNYGHHNNISKEDELNRTDKTKQKNQHMNYENIPMFSSLEPGRGVKSSIVDLNTCTSEKGNSSISSKEHNQRTSTGTKNHRIDHHLPDNSSPLYNKAETNMFNIKRMKKENTCSTVQREYLDSPIVITSMNPNSNYQNLFNIDDSDIVNLSDERYLDKMPLTDRILFVPDDLKDYRFSNGKGFQEIYEEILRSFPNYTFPSVTWLKNQYKWIIWKNMYLGFSCSEEKPCLAYEYIKKELLYRVNLEDCLCKRSCLKLIFECDGPANTFIVLIVSNIKGKMLELTDGWYSILAEVDEQISNHIEEGLIYPGKKLCIMNAKMNIETAFDPLEGYLKKNMILNSNSVRSAIWSQPVGYQKEKAFPVSIASVVGGCGVIPEVNIIVTRKFPILFKEKHSKPGSNYVIRNLDNLMKIEERKEAEMREEIEKNHELWMNEILDNNLKEVSSNDLKIIIKSEDKELLLREFDTKKREMLEREYYEFYESIERQFRERCRMVERESKIEYTCFFTFNGVDLTMNSHTEFEMTIWNASYEFYDLLKEGVCVKLYNVDVSEKKNYKLYTSSVPEFEIVNKNMDFTKFLYQRSNYLESLLELERKIDFCHCFGSLFNITGFIIEVVDNGLYIGDGSSTCVKVEFSDDTIKKFERKEKSKISFRNLSYLDFNSSNGLFRFKFVESTIVEKNVSIVHENKLNRIILLSDFGHYKERVDLYKNNSCFDYDQSVIEFINNSNQIQIVSLDSFSQISICRLNDIVLACFDTPFQTDQQCKNYIRQKLTLPGLNLLIKLSNGISNVYALIENNMTNEFLNVIVNSFSNVCKTQLLMHIKRLFDGSSDQSSIRLKVINQLDVDISNIPKMLGLILERFYIYYDDNHSLVYEVCCKDGYLPFTYTEWSNFVVYISNVFITVEFCVKLDMISKFLVRVLLIREI